MILTSLTSSEQLLLAHQSTIKSENLTATPKFRKIWLNAHARNHQSFLPATTHPRKVVLTPDSIMLPAFGCDRGVHTYRYRHLDSIKQTDSNPAKISVIAVPLTISDVLANSNFSSLSRKRESGNRYRDSCSCRSRSAGCAPVPCSRVRGSSA